MDTLDRVRPGWDRDDDGTRPEIGLDQVFNEIWEEAERRRARAHAEEDPEVRGDGSPRGIGGGSLNRAGVPGRPCAPAPIYSAGRLPEASSTARRLG